MHKYKQCSMSSNEEIRQGNWEQIHLFCVRNKDTALYLRIEAHTPQARWGKHIQGSAPQQAAIDRNASR